MSVCRTESGLRVYIKPEEIWPFFMANKERLRKEMCLVAENEDTKYELRLDIDGDYPVLRIFYDGEAEYGQYIATGGDAPSITRGLILTRLCPVLEESDIPDDQNAEVAAGENCPDEDDDGFNEICQAMIDVREEQLYSAVGDFLSTLLNKCSDDLYGGDMPDAILDSVCTILARRFKISVFRPTWLPVKGGEEEVYEEYPYLDTDKPGVIAAEPLDYNEATDYLDAQFNEGYYDTDEQGRDDFPVS